LLIFFYIFAKIIETEKFFWKGKNYAN